MLRSLTRLQEEVSDIKRMLVLKKSVGGNNDFQQGQLQLPVSLPLSSVEDFNALNEWLQEIDNRKKLVTFFGNHFKL